MPNSQAPTNFRHVYDRLWETTDLQRASHRERLWLRVINLLTDWPIDSATMPMVERRLWRADSGKLRETLIIKLSDPTGTLDRHSRMTEVKELARPLRESLPVRLSSDELLVALDSTRFRNVAELSPPLDLDLDEGLLFDTFGDLMRGLGESEGPVALSLLVSPTDPDAGVQLNDPDGNARMVNFRLRMATTDPLPLALMARASSICSFAGGGAWSVARGDSELESAERALREHQAITPGNSHSQPWIASLLMSVSPPPKTLLADNEVGIAGPERTSQHLLEDERDALSTLRAANPEWFFGKHEMDSLLGTDGHEGQE